jgi:hypothetical protein
MQKIFCFSAICLFFFYSMASAEMLDNGDGTVTDTDTGLIWQQAEGGAMTWEEALVYCETLDLAGLNDWRLPNSNELQSIVNYDLTAPSIDTTFFPGAHSSSYWASTTNTSNVIHAWSVTFNNGSVIPNLKSGSFYVRAVRSGN